MVCELKKFGHEKWLIAKGSSKLNPKCWLAFRRRYSGPHFYDKSFLITWWRREFLNIAKIINAMTITDKQEKDHGQTSDQGQDNWGVTRNKRPFLLGWNGTSKSTMIITRSNKAISETEAQKILQASCDTVLCFSAKCIPSCRSCLRQFSFKFIYVFGTLLHLKVQILANPKPMDHAIEWFTKSITSRSES